MIGNYLVTAVFMFVLVLAFSGMIRTVRTDIMRRRQQRQFREMILGMLKREV